MNDLRSLKERVREKCGEHTAIALWLSGGSDSLLLLNVLLDLNVDFSVLRFDHGWTREQSREFDRIAIRYNLMCFSYPPHANLLIGNGDEVALVSSYALDASGQGGSLIRDLVDDPKRCAFDVMIPLPKVTGAPIEFDMHILGTKHEDTHFANPDFSLVPGETWKIGKKEMFAPLAEWTKAEVLEALANYNTAPVAIDTGDIHACTNCLKAEKAFCPKVNHEIQGVKWDGKANLAMFQTVRTSTQ